MALDDRSQGLWQNCRDQQRAVVQHSHAVYGTDDIDSAKDLLGYTGQLVAQNIPNLAVSAAGAIAGRKLAPISKIAKKLSPKAKEIADAGLGGIVTQFGVNMFGGALLNEDELVAQGMQKEVDVGAAALYGLSAAA